MLKTMRSDKVLVWFGVLQLCTNLPLFGATYGIEGAQGSHDPIESTCWSKLCDEYQDVFAKLTGVPTNCKFTHCIDLIDENL